MQVAGAAVAMVEMTTKYGNTIQNGLNNVQRISLLVISLMRVLILARGSQIPDWFKLSKLVEIMLYLHSGQYSVLFLYLQIRSQCVPPRNRKCSSELIAASWVSQRRETPETETGGCWTWTGGWSHWCDLGWEIRNKLKCNIYLVIRTHNAMQWM